MNCNLCIAHLREKRKCPGCRESNENKSNYCINCVIKNCSKLEQKKWKFCSDNCEEYPCARLKNLDKRYRTKYGMSMIENLENIKALGIRKFVIMEKNKWIREDKIFCVHKKEYYTLRK